MSEEKQDNSLTNLLAALALGARSVNALPSSENDELDYQMAFPEYNSLCVETRDLLASILNNTLQKSGVSLTDSEEDFEFDDPLLWENAAEVCDVLSEHIDLYIQNYKEAREGLDVDQVAAINRVADVARNKAKNGFDQMLTSIVEMEKPQKVYGFSDLIDNSRTEPFVPYVHPERPFMIDPDGFDLVAQPGHGLESRIPGTILSIPEDVIAPDVHYLHPYQREIESLEYNSFQTDITNIKLGTHGNSGTLHNPSLASIKGIWIDKEKDLERLAARINDAKNEIREIAVDLEAHSFRSFSGFVCLMQLSLRRPTVSDEMLADPLDGGDSIDTGYDFLIDTLALRRVMNTHLAPIFANPDIVKVMHGANSDIEWLQRDFGIYVVNLFDTGRAARLIPFITSASLAYLLRKYAGVEADKKHQLSDWRQRPLPSDMLSYAASDTLYLLDIYDALRMELSKCEQKNSEINIKTALDDSKKVCLARYSKAPFKPEDYTKLMMSKRGKSNCNLTENQKLALKSLCDWRDRVARDEDESLHYVCSNSGLLRIASTSPSSISVLQTCVNPLPPLVLKFATEVLGIIKKSQGREFVSFTPLLSKPNIIRQENADSEHVHIKVQDESSSSEDAEVSGIMTDKANRDFTSLNYTPHSLQMNAPLKGVGSRSKSVNGIGAAKAVIPDADEQSRIAEICAIRIRGHLASGKQNLLGIVHGSFFDDENKQEDSFNDDESVKNDDDNEDDDYTLPKSMKEIYQMSNRNRNRNKKTPVVFDDVKTTDEVMTIEQAEVLLSKSGPNGSDYFQDNSCKRQRTTKSDVCEYESADAGESDKNDVKLMIDLGWIENEQEASVMMEEQTKSLIDNGIDSNKDSNGQKQKNSSTDADQTSNKHSNKRDKRIGKQQNITPFNYSNVGSIGVGGSSGVENPFFSGAAVSGIPSQYSNNNKEKKKQARQNPRKGGKKPLPTGGAQSSFVYRK